MHMTLIGPRGSGKNTLGEALAKRVGANFSDLDVIIERSEGRSIADIFAQEGETRFREIEREVFRKHHRRTGTVLATGGGVVLHPQSREELIASRHTVLLLAPASLLADRIRGSERPSLTGADAASEIGQVLSRRLDLYHKCAAHVLDTASITIEEATDVLEQFWYSFSHHQFR